MAASTTTIETIRDALETQIAAIEPSTASGVPLRLSRGDEDFRAWAQGNPAACLRRYTIEQEGETEEGEIRTGSVEEFRVALTIVAAYPHMFGAYASAGLENYQDVLDMIEEDAESIQSVAGMTGNANYPAGSHPLSDDYEIEAGEGVTFLVMTLAIRYYRSTSA